jgi:hypothetical protein
VAKLLVTVRKSRWYSGGLPSFLEKNDIPADCLTDLRTQQNEMSAWRIEADNSNLHRVLTALAATRHDADHIEYILFEESIVPGLGIKITKTHGGTPDTHANRMWHYDLAELSGARLLALANGMFRNSETGRVLNKKVLELVKAGVARSEIDASKLTSKLAAKVSAGPMHPVKRFARACLRLRSAAKDAWQEFRQI